MMYHPQMPDMVRTDFERRARRRLSLRRLFFDTLGAVALGVLLSLNWDQLAAALVAVIF